jgi:hypothetical protein
MQFQPFTPSRELISQPDVLRERMDKEGYLFISGLVPPEDAPRRVRRHPTDLSRGGVGR